MKNYEVKMNKNVIVFGATGKTGIEICNCLSDAKVPHFAFVRKDSGQSLKNEDTKLIFGNVLEKNDIENLFTVNSFSDIVIALGARDLKVNFIRSEATMIILKVLKDKLLDVNIHVVSALGVNESWVQLNWLNKLFCKFLIKNAMIDHGLQEEYVVNSSQKFHIIRPVGLQDGVKINKIIVQNEGFLPYNTVLRSDVAKYLVDSLLEGKTGFSSVCKA